MKKIEAQIIAPEKSKIIIECITQILSSKEKVNATMNFNSRKIDNQNMCVLDIYVPQDNYEKHLNLDITSEHNLILYEQLLNDLLDNFVEHETIGVTKYYAIKSMQENFTGINAVNILGSKIRINFNASGFDFSTIISNYTKRYNEIVEKSQKEQSKTR